MGQVFGSEGPLNDDLGTKEWLWLAASSSGWRGWSVLALISSELCRSQRVITEPAWDGAPALGPGSFHRHGHCSVPSQPCCRA